MTRDAAAQAVHERLEHLVATLPEPDVEAGWAALVTQLELPVAPVVPLRRPRPRRALVLGAAAAVLIAGSALAVVRHGRDGGRPAQTPPPTTAPSHVGSGPRTHRSFSGPPTVSHPDPPPAGDGHQDGATGPSGGSASSGPSEDHTSDTHTGTTHHDGTHTPHHDAADDTDHGTGNDGSHDDNGQGNDVQGQDTQGNGSGGGSGNEQGSGGGKGSGNRGTGSGGANPNSRSGSDSGQASHGQGQGGGQGSNN
jgi:antitoxin (DNA-binding transcriptional repressor) of toxin-antitoxin stability system